MNNYYENQFELAIANIKFYNKIGLYGIAELWETEKEFIILDLVQKGNL
jgi:hypothetical protein